MSRPDDVAAQDRWPDGSADECPKCGFLHAYDRSCEDRASSAAQDQGCLSEQAPDTVSGGGTPGTSSAAQGRSEDGWVPGMTLDEPVADERCESVSVRGLRCQYPRGHQLSHGYQGTEWSVGRGS